MWESITSYPWPFILMMAGLAVVAIFIIYLLVRKQYLLTLSNLQMAKRVTLCGLTALVFVVSGFIWDQAHKDQVIAERQQSERQKARDKVLAEQDVDKALLILNGPPLPARKLPPPVGKPAKVPDGMDPNGWGCTLDGVKAEKVGVFRTTENFLLVMTHPKVGEITLEGAEQFTSPSDLEVLNEFPDLRVFVVEGSVQDGDKQKTGTFRMENQSWKTGYRSDFNGTIRFNDTSLKPVVLRVVLP